MVETPHSLLHRLRHADDPNDWERLVAIYTPWVRSWLTRHGVVNDVDDLVQDVMIVIVDKIKVYEHNQRQGAFRNYLRKVTFHRLSQLLRKRKVDAVGGTEVHNLIQQLDDPHSPLSKQWDREHDRFVMNQLFANLRDTFAEETWKAFELLMLKDMPASEVADRLGTSVNAVYIAKSRVLKKLREEAEGLVEGDRSR